MMTFFDCYFCLCQNVQATAANACLCSQATPKIYRGLSLNTTLSSSMEASVNFADTLVSREGISIVLIIICSIIQIWHWVKAQELCFTGIEVYNAGMSLRFQVAA